MSIAEKLQTIAENEQKVYDKGEERGHMQGFGEGYTNGYNQGYEDGKAEGGGGGDTTAAYEQGVADGKKAHFNDVWHNIVKSGVHLYALSGKGWNDETFLPSEDIVLNANPTGIFYHTGFTNLKKILDDAGVVLDTSAAEQFQSFFQFSTVTEVPTIDMTSALNAMGMFNTATSLRKIWGIIPPKLESCSTNYMFNGCSALEEITINGTIVVNGLNFSACKKLSRASIKSIMDALSTTVSGMPTITLSLVAVDKAFETSEGANDGRYSDAWYGLYYAHTDKWVVSLL